MTYRCKGKQEDSGGKSLNKACKEEELQGCKDIKRDRNGNWRMMNPQKGPQKEVKGGGTP